MLHLPNLNCKDKETIRTETNLGKRVSRAGGEVMPAMPAEIRAEMYMPKRVIVDVDLAAVAANLSSEDRREVGEAEARQFLLDAGFQPHGDRWIVEEPNLGHLEPSEVRSLEDAPDNLPDAPPDASADDSADDSEDADE